MQTHHTDAARGFICEDGQVGVFKRFVTKPTRRTASFGEPELHLLHFILVGLLNGHDISQATRHPEFAKLALKATNMRRKSKAAAEALRDD